MSKTHPIVVQPSAEEMRSRGYTESAVEGILHIRELDDAPLLAAARDESSVEHGAIMALLTAGGRQVNPSWVTAVCAEEAYERGLIGEQELDWLMR